MADGSNHYPGRSFIRKGQDPTLHDNPQRMRRPRIGHEPHTAVPIRAFRHRPNNVRAADVLGHDSGASNLAEYATEPNRYDLPAWMVEDIHTLGPINAQLKWKRQKDEVKMAAEAAKSLTPHVDIEPDVSSLVEVTRQDCDTRLDLASTHPSAAPDNSLQDVAFNGDVFLSTERFDFIDGWGDELEICDNKTGESWSINDNEQMKVYHYLRPTEVWSKKRSVHRLSVPDYFAIHSKELASALAGSEMVLQGLADAIELPGTSIIWSSTLISRSSEIDIGRVIETTEPFDCDQAAALRQSPFIDGNQQDSPPCSRADGDSTLVIGTLRSQGDVEATGVTKKTYNFGDEKRVETQRTNLSTGKNRGGLPAAKCEIFQGARESKRCRLGSISNNQQRETPITHSRNGLETLERTSAKRKADREESPPRKKAREQEQAFKAQSPPRMTLTELASYLATEKAEKAEKARAAALNSGERKLLPSHKVGETAAVPLTLGQRKIVFKYQQVNEKAAALSAARSQEISRSRTPLPSKREDIVQRKTSPTPLPAQVVSLPIGALPRTMLPPPSPIQTMSFIKGPPRAIMLLISSPLPNVAPTPVSSQLMMKETPSPVASAVFAPGGCSVMMNQTPSPIRVPGLRGGGAPLPILSLSQDQTIDTLTHDICRHANDVRAWMNNGWKTPIELGFDHMVMLRDHEMLALRMALEFERVDEVDTGLMKMSDKLHESAVMMYERTKIFLGETVEQQDQMEWVL